MAITYFTQSKKDIVPIYIRIREGRKIDAKARTQFYIKKGRLSQGKIILHKNQPSATADVKIKTKSKNKDLIELKDNLLNLASLVNKKLNNRKEYELINSNWLKDIVNPTKDTIPAKLTEYFDYYLEDKKTFIKNSTAKKIKSILNRLKKFEKDNGTIYIVEVNTIFKNKFFKWLDTKGYAHNTKIKTLSVSAEVCRHARENGILTHPELNKLTKGLKYKDTPHVYLNSEDLAKIERVELPNEKLDIARDWLLISCYTAQRVSDFLKFTKKNIIKVDGDSYLDIKQRKTGTQVHIYLRRVVLSIIRKYKGNFPPSFSNNENSNEVIYNRLIKRVCQIAKIEELVEANLRQTKENRYKIVEVPKWKAVSSHIGRRSFATNYFGVIDTSLLKDATGHSTEKQFLTYVGLKTIDKAKALGQEFKKLDLEEEVKLTVIKNILN